MKKTIKSLVLLFVAATMFMGCGLQKEEEKECIEEALFDVSELKDDTNKLQLSTGHWIIREWINADDESSAMEMSYYVKKDSKKDSGFAYDGSKDSTFKLSLNGDCTVYDNDYKFDTDTPEGVAYFALAIAVTLYTEYTPEIEGCKTNSDKTKFYWTQINKDGETVKWYLQKSI